MTSLDLVLEPPIKATQPRLQTCGFAVDDTATIVERLAAGISLEALSREIAEGRLLRKRSPSGRKQVLAAVRIRYAEASRPLPRLPELAAMLEEVSSKVGRSQLLLPYLLLADRAVYEVVLSTVLPRLPTGGYLKKSDVVTALDAVLERHGRGRWSESLRTRWAQGVLSILRDVEALGRGRNRENLKPYSPRPEVFSFHLWGLYENGLRGTALHESLFWRTLLLSEGDVRRLLGVVSDCGWWRFTSLAGTNEVRPNFGSLMEWITVGLG